MLLMVHLWSHQFLCFWIWGESCPACKHHDGYLFAHNEPQIRLWMLHLLNILLTLHFRIPTCLTYRHFFRWWVGPWQHCSTTCGSGIHHRTVICVRSLSSNEQIALEDHECEDQSRPTSSEPCHHKEQCPEQQAWWVTGEWRPVRFQII